jgi:site-specific DNA-cytosine methylase
MKTKLMIISVLTAASILVLSPATWADSKKDRRNKKPRQTHYTVAKQPKAFHHQDHWKQKSRYRDKKHRYHKRLHHRDKYHRRAGHNRHYRHKPYYKHVHKHGWYYKPHHTIQRPVKKHYRKRHHRPIFSHTDGNVSILASTSRRGLSIKILARD